MERFFLICLILIIAGSLVAQTPPTVASLNVTSGSAIKWYSTATGGTQYNGTEALEKGRYDLCKPNGELHRKCNTAAYRRYSKLINS